MTARTSRRARVAGLYVVTPAIADTTALVRSVTAAIDGGASVVQYRNKAASAATARTQALALARVAAARSALFIVNDDARLAAEVDADGVHIGDDDGSVAAARAIVGSERLIGVSCHDDYAHARAAVTSGADYVAFGSFFESTTKPAAPRADPALLARAAALGVPVVAIGGITSANARALIDAGADAVAVIADVFAHEDAGAITQAATAIATLFDAARNHPVARSA